MTLLHSSLLFSIVVQVITGVIELLALFVKTAPGMALIKQLLGLELAVQAVEGAFYAWLYYTIDRVKNITPNRYADWAITTPTMLVTLVAYIVYLNAPSSDSLSLLQILRENAAPIAQILGLNWLMLLFGYLGEVGVIPLVTGVALGFVPFIAYFYIMYERFIHNATNANNATSAIINSTSMKIYAYFLVFWSLYGIVAVLPYALKNTIYNVLDLFAKNFFGLFLSYLIVSNAISS